MSRFQLSLNVVDVDAAVEFYSSFFGVAPAKHREGYASFVVTDPPLKLVVIEHEGEPGTINHVGIEFENAEQVATESQRVAAGGLSVVVDEPHTCCFATQDKSWTRDADGVPWELYTVLADTDEFGHNPHGAIQVDELLPPVDRSELKAALEDSNIVVIDAQAEGKFEKSHIPGAVNFALEGVAKQAALVLTGSDQPVIVYCTDEMCLGSEFVGTLLLEAGYTNVRRYAGGVRDWTAADLSVESGSL